MTYRPTHTCSCPSPPRRSDEIVRWVKKKTGPATTEVSTVEALEAAQKESSVSVLAFFDKFEGDAHAAFETGERRAASLAGS